ncbi:MAG: cytochrome c [Pseudomonadales bacterium]|jgi:cytochrome c553
MRPIALVVLTVAILTTPAAMAAGNAADGEAKAGLCAACHGPEGISGNPLWPNLAGQKAAYLAKQIKAFRDGTRQEPTMAPFVQNLTDQDADDLAAHFASLKTCP